MVLGSVSSFRPVTPFLAPISNRDILRDKKLSRRFAIQSVVFLALRRIERGDMNACFLSVNFPNRWRASVERIDIAVIAARQECNRN
jgi:hypothetical protein